MFKKNWVFVIPLYLAASFGCTKKTEEMEMYYLDWVGLGARAPSVLPEIERETVNFTVSKVSKVPEFDSPAVLAPYNVKMKLDTVIEGLVGGAPRKLSAPSALIAKKGDLSGKTIRLTVGKTKREYVYEID